MESDDSDAWSLVQENDTFYSQDEFVLALTAFYEFLTTLFLPKAKIKHPPPEGWDIKQDGISPPIDDTVWSLLKHIPYLQTAHVVDHAAVMYWRTSPIDYSTQEFKREVPMFPDVVSEYSYVPPHVIRLTRWVEGDGYCCFLDTKRGTISWVDYIWGSTRKCTQHGFRNYAQKSSDFPSGKVGREEQQQDWREFATYSVRDFFEMLRIEFRLLNVIPIHFELIQRGQDLDDTCDEEKALLDIQKVYRVHGWPESLDDKETCLQEVGDIWRLQDELLSSEIAEDAHEEKEQDENSRSTARVDNAEPAILAQLSLKEIPRSPSEAD